MNHPPKLPHRFFRWYCHPRMRDYIEGDLLEVYDRRVKEFGKRKADWKFILDVLLLFRPGIIRPRKPYQNLSTFPMYKSYFKIGWRNLLKNKTHSLVNMGGLSIGMAAAMLILLFLKDEYRYDLFHEKSPSIYRVVVDWVHPDGTVKDNSGHTGYFQAAKFNEAIPEISGAVRWQETRKTIKMGNEVSDITSCFNTDPNFFAEFTFPFLDGNPETALIHPHSIVLTEERAIALFNATNAVGQTLDIQVGSEFVPYKVTGVVRSLPQNSSIKFDYVLPLDVNPSAYANNDNWFNFFLHTFVILHPSADPRVVESKMNEVYRSDASGTIKTMLEKFNFVNQANYRLQPLGDLHLSQEFEAENGLRDGSNPMYGYILSGIAFFILLIACINFINLSIARSLKRAKEIGIRKVVGGNRFSLATQFMSESYLMCFVAFLLAILLVQLSLPLFNQLSQKSIVFSELVDLKLTGAFVALFVVTGFIAGFYPSLVLSGFSPTKILYSRFRFSGNNAFQKGLVVIQFALAAFLIMATFTIYSQFDFMTTTDLGYDDKNLVRVDRHAITHSEFETFKKTLLQHPGIVDVAPKNGGESGTLVKVNGEQQIEFNYNIVDETYLPLMKIGLVAGRNFSPEFPSDGVHSVLVNEAFVREAGWKDPIGQQVNFWHQNDTKYTVVGVVSNHHFRALNREISPQLFSMKPEENFGRVLIRLNGASNRDALVHVEKTFKSHFPNSPYSYQFVEESNREMYQLEARWKQILLLGSVLAIFISCIGLFGLAALTVERRTKELGIRKIMGASINDITHLLSVGFVKLVIVAFAFALPAAYLVSGKWLNTYPYHVQFSETTVFVTLFINVFIAFLIVGIQAVRSALMNPVNSLRSE